MSKKTDYTMTFKEFSISYDIIGDISSSPLIMIHGAGNASKNRFNKLRFLLQKKNISSVSIDCIGHGKSNGVVGDSSLALRTEVIIALINNLQLKPPFKFMGTSMGAYNVLKLSEIYPTDLLILGVPGVYTPQAYNTHFNISFSNIIRKKNSWMKSDAWEILQNYNGKLLIFSSKIDKVIPIEIPNKIYKSASSAKEKELVWLKECSHQFINTINEDSKLMEKVLLKIYDFFK